MATQIRRVQPDDWQHSRQFRLAALLDAAAPVAFLESHADATERPDEFWQDRARGASTGDDAAQLIASDGDDWVGTVTVLVVAAGVADHHNRVAQQRRANVVGVYVAPTHRGTGLIAELLDAAAAWAGELGIPELALDVHSDNARAQAAYRRAGFVPTGGSFVGPIGPEIDMVRALNT